MYEIWITCQETGREGRYDGPYESLSNAEQALLNSIQAERPESDDLWIRERLLEIADSNIS